MSYPVLIILTTTVYINPNKTFLYQKGQEERLKTYLNSIRKWMEETSFNILVVENSGYEFKELDEYKEKYGDRFDFVSYIEKDIVHEDFYTNQSKGISELFAIQLGYNKSKFFEKVEFIMKVTGRYFIPGFYDYLLNNNFFVRCKVTGHPYVQNEILVLRQNNQKRCELFGCNNKIFDFIFSFSTHCNNGGCYLGIEDVIEKRIKMINPDYIFICKQLYIEPTQQGGINNINRDL